MPSGAVSGGPFGLSYRLLVTTTDASGQQTQISYSDSAFAPQALRITFEVQQARAAVWTAEISIYNLSPAQQQQALTNGGIVQLYAGYLTSSPGLIFQGDIYQVTFDRVDVVDFVTTFRCVSGTSLLTRNFVSTNIAAYSTQDQFVSKMAAAAYAPFATTLVDSSVLRPDSLPRGQVAFGSIEHYWRQVATDANADYWATDGPPAIGKVANTDGTAALTFAPPLPRNGTYTSPPGTSHTLQGTPQQTDQGVAFRVNLDPRVRFSGNPPMLVALDMSVIQQLARPTPTQSGSLIAPWSQSGTYAVAGVRHVGDSRGADWYTEITAVVPGGAYQAVIGG